MNIAKFFNKQASFGLPTTVTKMGEDQKGPKAYVVEQTKYKSLLSGAVCMIVAFGFLYLAFSSERASFNQRSEQIFQVEEHQRMEKQTAELKLLQITQMLTAHLDSEIEEEQEMKQLYVNMIDTQSQGTAKLEQLLHDSSDKTAVMAAFSQIMFDVNAIVGNHERESRKRGDHARALLQNIHKNVILELEHEVEDDVDDQFIEFAAKKRNLHLAASDEAQNTHTHAAFDSMLTYLQSKVLTMEDVDEATHFAALSDWDSLLQSMEGHAVSKEQMMELVTMVQTLPSSLRHSQYAATITSIAENGAHNNGDDVHETRLASLSKNMHLLLGDMHALTHKASLMHALSDWSNGTHTPHQTFLRMQMMAKNGQVPSRWLSDAAEAQLEVEAEAHHRAATPPPVPRTATASQNNDHAAL